MRVHVGNGDRRMRGNLPLNGNGRLHEVRSPEIGTKPFGGSLRAAGGERRARRYCREKIRIGHDVLRLGYPVVSLQGEDARDVEALIEPAKARTNNRLWLRSCLAASGSPRQAKARGKIVPVINRRLPFVPQAEIDGQSPVESPFIPEEGASGFLVDGDRRVSCID